MPPKRVRATVTDKSHSAAAAASNPLTNNFSLTSIPLPSPHQAAFLAPCKDSDVRLLVSSAFDGRYSHPETAASVYKAAVLKRNLAEVPTATDIAKWSSYFADAFSRFSNVGSGSHYGDSDSRKFKRNPLLFIRIGSLSGEKQLEQICAEQNDIDKFSLDKD